MSDKERVIKGLYDIGGFIAGRIGFEQARNFLRTIDDTVALLNEQEAAYQGAVELLRQKTILFDDAIKRLKEQEAKPLRCKTCTMRDKTGFCHRWNREIKDNDYCSFGAWKGC